MRIPARMRASEIQTKLKTRWFLEILGRISMRMSRMLRMVMTRENIWELVPENRV